MPRPLFSEMLVSRRRQLGLTISQAAKVLKLKEQVLVAFEEGDFANIPKSGYAQGMLSSYARYLGLNPRQVVDQFSEDLYEALYGEDAAAGRRPSRAARSRRQDAPGGALGSPADARSYRSFDTTSPVHGRSENWYHERRLPLVNPRTIEGERARYQAAPPAGDVGWDDPDATMRVSHPLRGHRYTERVPGSEPDGASRAPRPGQRRGRAPYAAGDGRDGSRRPYRSGDVYTRDVPSGYRDDRRLEDEPTSYEIASTASGRRSSRNIASTERPSNVRRGSRDAARRELQSRDRRRQPPREGVLGVVDALLSDPRRAALVVMALLGLLLFGIIVFSVRSCASSGSRPETVPVTKVADERDDEPETEDAAADAEDEQADAEAADDADSEDDASGEAVVDAAPEQVTVVVSVEEGGVSWLEITCDGQSVVADTVTGPWEQTFDVKESISIQAGDTTAVSVTENGERVQFGTRSSGIGTISIQGPEQASADEADAQGAQGAQ